MVYTIDVNRWGSFFSVPCDVAQKYLKLSSGEFIKVLLCVLSGGSPKVDTAEISKLSGVSEEVVEEALLQWNSLGVITIEGKEQARIKEHSAAVSVADTVGTPKAEQKAQEKKAVIRYTPSDLLRLAESSDEIRSMFLEVEKALSRTISSTDQAALVDIHEYYGFPVASIVLLSKYCRDIGKDSMAYIRSVAKDWHEKNIIQPRDVDIEVIRLTEYHSYENEVKRVLGLTAKTTKRQQGFFEKWKASGISLELIEMAGEQSIDNTDKHTVNLNYMDKVISAWEQAGVKTVKQAQKLLDDMQSKTIVSGKGRSDNGKSYDIDEFDAFSSGYVPKLSKKHKGGDVQ